MTKNAERNQTEERIEILEKDLKNRVVEECESIRKTANPKHEVDTYIRNLRWESPELAAFLEKEIHGAAGEGGDLAMSDVIVSDEEIKLEEMKEKFWKRWKKDERYRNHLEVMRTLNSLKFNIGMLLVAALIELSAIIVILTLIIFLY